MTLEQFYTYQEQTFDSFCKRVIRNESTDIFREFAYRRKHEVSFSALPEAEVAKLQVDDRYVFAQKVFYVLDHTVEVNDPALGEMLQFIHPNLRNIVLLSYFLGYTDPEIGKLLHTNKKTVQHRRVTALRQLRKLLEGKDHE